MTKNFVQNELLDSSQALSSCVAIFDRACNLERTS